METFSALLAFCAGNSPVTGEFPTQRPVTQSFDVFFDLRLKKRLSKQWRRWWFETPSRSLWRHRNGIEKCRLYFNIFLDGTLSKLKWEGVKTTATLYHAVSANRILWVYAGFWWYHGILVVHLQDSVGAFWAIKDQDASIRGLSVENVMTDGLSRVCIWWCIMLSLITKITGIYFVREKC